MIKILSTENSPLQQQRLLIASAVITMALPIILVLTEKIAGNTAVLNSISAYYYSSSRDIFVGMLFAVSVILFLYRGQNLKENIALDLAAVFGIITAIVPTNPDMMSCDFACSKWVTPYCIHILAAVAFFLCLAYVSFFCFRKQCNTQNHSKKNLRRYENLFALLAVLLILFPALTIFFSSGIINLNSSCSKLVFWVEILAIYSLGCLWLTKYFESKDNANEC